MTGDSAGDSVEKAVVARYFEGFRQGNHALILSLLTDDVAWDLPGFRHLSGKEAFDGEIENPDFEGQPNLAVDRLIQEGDAVVAVGEGTGTQRGGRRFRFAFCDVFTFRGELICRVESYLVPLGEGGQG
jgi:ketosteroid isomerase-like protein